MRTIKFRIYNKKTSKWIHGPNARHDLDGVNLFGETILFGELLNGVSVQDLNDIVALQFTGLKDKNGREIFEGDIIRFQTEDNPEDLQWELSEVKFESGAFCLSNKYFQYIHEFIMSDGTTEMEIVGNIFDNPELL